MEGRRRLGDHVERRLAPQNRGMPRLSVRRHRVSGTRRIRGLPLTNTPHIPGAAQYFENLERQEEAGGNNLLVAAASQGPTPEVGINENEVVGKQGAQPAKGSRRKPKRHVVNKMDIPPRPNFKHTLKKAQDFVNIAELEAKEISVHRVCSSKRIHSWSLLVDRGVVLQCSMTRAAGQNKMSAADLRLAENLKTANEKVEQLVGQFREKLEKERKALKMARGLESRRRVCCKVCFNKNRD